MSKIKNFQSCCGFVWASFTVYLIGKVSVIHAIIPTNYKQIQIVSSKLYYKICLLSSFAVESWSCEVCIKLRTFVIDAKTFLIHWQWAIISSIGDSEVTQFLKASPSIKKILLAFLKIWPLDSGFVTFCWVLIVK